ncbi:MAG: BamA/TamA family outer membrane protein [Fibromonadaceae bacterium]|jgi:hypothetical protein|nr:BamA/TamA family outer membrane protein [Fibromonadaceae bacterium]
MKIKNIAFAFFACSLLFAQDSEDNDFFEFKRFLVLPVGAYSEETGIILGAGALFFIESPAEDGSSGGSNFATVIMTSLKKQITLENRLILEPSKHWNLLAYLSIRNWPTQYFGKGNDLNESDYAVYTAKGVHVPISLGTNLFLPESWKSNFKYGIEVDGEYMAFDYAEEFPEFRNTDMENSRRYGVGYNLTYNSSEKNDWPRKGSFVQFRHIFFNSKDNSWQSKANYFVWKNLDTRMYLPLSFLPEGVLALGSYLEDFEGEVPFDRFAKPDGVGQLRGLKKGLLADRTSWVLQSELRTHLFWRCKGTLFYEAAKVGSGIKNLNDNKWHDAIGIGGRFLVNKENKTHIRGDLSWVNRKSIGMAIKINEAF